MAETALIRARSPDGGTVHELVGTWGACTRLSVAVECAWTQERFWAGDPHVNFRGMWSANACL